MSTLLQQLGVTDADAAFKQHWVDKGFAPVARQNGVTTTSPIQGRYSAKTAAGRKQIKTNLGSTRKAMQDAAQKTMDATEVDANTPLVFDPEILSILKQNAPVLQVIPEQGQKGFTATFNYINQRDDPTGYVSEADSLNLLDQGNDITITKGSQDMRIYVDTADISDFTQAAAAHYMNVEDTTLGERIAAFAQLKAQAVLYGDTSKAVDDGGPGDPNAFDGLATSYTAAGNNVDKSAVTSDFAADVKAEIAAMLQTDKNILKSDLAIVTSHTMKDALEASVNGVARHHSNEDFVDYGLKNLAIDGVPVVPDHNVSAHSYTDGTDTYSPGDEGDVFIVNRRANQFRSLVPMSAMPLAKQGLSTEVALYEFGALIDRANGEFGRYLSAYAI